MPKRSKGSTNGTGADAGASDVDPPQRESVFQPEFIEDLINWVGTRASVPKRVLELVEAVMRDPFTGIGKPEPLKHWEPDTWSRRVTQADRIVYKVYANKVDFLQCRYHY